MTYTIMLRSNTTFIKVGNFSNVSFRYNSPVSPMPLPEEDSTENMLVKLEGNSMNLGLSWMLIEEKENMVGTDIKRVNNKWAIDPTPTQIKSKTPFEQMNQIKLLQPKGMSDTNFFIYILDDSVGGSTSYTYATIDSLDAKLLTVQGTWQSISFTIDASNPVNISTSLDFIEGKQVVTIYGHAPEASKIVSMTPNSFGDGTLTIRSTESSLYTANDRPTIAAVEFAGIRDGYDPVQKKVSFTRPVGVYTYDTVWSGVTAGSYTRMKIRLYDDKSAVGKWSEEFSTAVTVT